jgi:hypothetical protein
MVLCIPQPNIRVTEEEIIQILEEYEISASEKCRDYNLAAWNYNTDVENAIKIEELVSKMAYLYCIILKYVCHYMWANRYTVSLRNYSENKILHYRGFNHFPKKASI